MAIRNNNILIYGGIGILAVGLAYIYLSGRGPNAPDFSDQIRNKILSPLGFTKKSSNYGTSNTLAYGDF